MTYKAILSAGISSLILVGCSFPEKKATTVKKETPLVVMDEPDLDYVFEIEHFPQVYSYASEKLKRDLISKGVKPLSKKEKTRYLEITNTDFHVFPVNKITYEKATLIVYLVKEINDESFHEMDQLVLVIYNKEGKTIDVLSRNLQDLFSTREFEFTSPTEFTLVDTGPESEAEDIKSGREPAELSISTTYYRIDPVKMKFKEVN